MSFVRPRPTLALAGWAFAVLAAWSVLRRYGRPSLGVAAAAELAAARQRRRSIRIVAAVAIGALVLAGAAAGLYRLDQIRTQRDWAVALTGGDPARAPAVMIANGCTGCHEIPGVPGASGLVGPPLTGLAERVYIAGVLRNTPDNLVLWIRQARSVDPLSAMPSTEISEREARDVAAYLYAQP